MTCSPISVSLVVLVPSFRIPSRQGHSNPDHSPWFQMAKLPTAQAPSLEEVGAWDTDQTNPRTFIWDIGSDTLTSSVTIIENYSCKHTQPCSPSIGDHLPVKHGQNRERWRWKGEGNIHNPNDNAEYWDPAVSQNNTFPRFQVTWANECIPCQI